jgi:hypothetical protein
MQTSNSRRRILTILDGDDLLVASKFENQLIDLQDSQVSISNYFSFLDGDKNSEALIDI